MYRIRLHGRGGHGMKTASRILGNAFFAAGFEVQDAPRYGAERRGAPIFAYVRADRAPIHERGVIADPDLVVVADDTLVPVAAAGVLVGVSERTVLLLHTREAPEAWRERLAVEGPVVTLPPADEELGFVGAGCAGAAARFVGVIPREALAQAIREELADMRPEVVERNVAQGLAAFDAMAPHAGIVREGPEAGAGDRTPPDWIDLPFEAARISAPTIHGGATSVEVRTGLWRTMRPVIDYEHCNRCSWVCSTFCPDGAITVEADRTPRIDLDHCKGCMVCAAVCPPHAIGAIPEREAAEQERAAAQKEASP
jgi:pyruvate ferredoxin oxidoreductase gamma subunit